MPKKTTSVGKEKNTKKKTRQNKAEDCIDRAGHDSKML